jgi:4,5-DOPA dioxygenase extradiol
MRDEEQAWPQGPPPNEDQLAVAADEVATRAAAAQVEGRMPAVYLGHGAPLLVDDALWVAQLAAWARALPRPRAILMVSAHWTQEPLTLGATADGVPLVYDFYGFPERYYEATYPAPAAPELAEQVRGLLEGVEPVAHNAGRGLDHGAYVPLLVMYPEADVPVLQISMPSLEPERLLALGARLRPLRDEGVLIVGSGFLTHGLPFLRDFRTDAPPPDWSKDFDQWAAAALERSDLLGLADFRGVPSARYAHPTVEHFVPLFVTLGAAEPDAAMSTPIDGYFLGLSKRSIQVA